MANASVVITVKTEQTKAYWDQILQLPQNNLKLECLALSQFFKDLASGAQRGVVTVQTGSSAPVAASGTITLASVAADDTVTIGNITFTAKASPSGAVQFSQAGTDTQDGDSLVSKINAHSTLSKMVVATNASGVVTVTCLQKGDDGNAIGLTSSNGTRLAVTGSGFLTNGTGGSDDAGTVYTLGI